MLVSTYFLATIYCLQQIRETTSVLIPNNFGSGGMSMHMYASLAVCRQRIDAGPCRQWQTAFGYNADERRCVPFKFGGCAGNGNRFATVDECQSLCADGNDTAAGGRQRPAPAERKGYYRWHPMGRGGEFEFTER